MKNSFSLTRETMREQSFNENRAQSHLVIVTSFVAANFWNKLPMLRILTDGTKGLTILLGE